MDTTGRQLAVAFESGRLSYSSQEVDLHNSGLNQILSVSAARGYSLYHFSMADLFEHDGMAYAKASVLALPESWQSDPLECHLLLRKIEDRPVPLNDLDLCFFRADDVRNSGTANLDIIQTIEEHGTLIESVAATLNTNDKFELTRRVPELPLPLTYAPASLEEAIAAVNQLPDREGYFVLKDRYGYGCGHAVHRIKFADPELVEILKMYLSIYDHIIVQEYCSEISQGDLVVTFFDGELIAAMHREAAPGEWKTNFSLGATQLAHTLTPEQERIAREVQSSFSECRLMSVDMLQSGKVFEVNAFPGGKGLLELYGISLGTIVMDRLERELLGVPKVPRVGLKTVTAPPSDRWDDIYYQYREHPETVELVDVFTDEKFTLPTRELIEFRPQSPDFILSIPHSGILVPTQYKDHFVLDARSLLEIDLFSDILFEAIGGLQVISRLAPFFVDINRSREGSESRQVPRHLTNPPTEYYTIEDEPVLQKDYNSSEEESILKYYDLYHGILSTLIENLKRERGYALLIDGHSMSSVGLGRVHDEGLERDNIVIGTLDDTSAYPEIIKAFVNALRKGIKPHRLGLTYAKNDPYAGGFITRIHSDPRNDVHVIQVEVTMDTYMYEPMEVDRVKRYALKQSRLRIAQDFLRQAALAASEEARRIYA